MDTVEARAPSLLHDVWAADVSSEDSFVEDLLNFSCADEELEVEEDMRFLSASPETEKSAQGNANDDFGSFPGDEISFPTDAIADLEWLSNFVEDSFSVQSAALPEIPAVHRVENRSESGKPGSARLCFQTPVPGKARTKRARTGGRVWFPPFSSSPYSAILLNRSQGSESVQFGSMTPMKKPRKSPDHGSGPSGRRCSHCGVQKTPQWRAGPMGSKTLCNACGVRFKSGRLLPEYRPACSPEFSNELHSNHHRKVVEMRRKKELLGQPQVPLPGFDKLS